MASQAMDPARMSLCSLFISCIAMAFVDCGLALLGTRKNGKRPQSRRTAAFCSLMTVNRASHRGPERSGGAARTSGDRNGGQERLHLAADVVEADLVLRPVAGALGREQPLRISDRHTRFGQKGSALEARIVGGNHSGTLQSSRARRPVWTLGNPKHTQDAATLPHGECCQSKLKRHGCGESKRGLRRERYGRKCRFSRGAARSS